MAKIDSHNLGAGPFEFERYLNPGQHEVTLSAPGYEPVQQTHQCDAGSESEINGQLVEIVPPPPETPPLWPVAVGGGVALGGGIGLMVAAGGEDSDADALLAYAARRTASDG